VVFAVLLLSQILQHHVGHPPFWISKSFHPQAGDSFLTGFHTVLPSTIGGDDQPKQLSRTGLAEASEITGIPPASGT
jgi:hypothetical protein